MFADVSTTSNWSVLTPVVVSALAVWYMLPSPRQRLRTLGVLAGMIGLCGFGAMLLHGFGSVLPQSVEAVLFVGFALISIGFATLMITARTPARSALAFAIVVLSVCGLFLLLAAPFLMAATIVIYAGAIIVVFLFVIMLSQQAHLTDADVRSRDPDLAVLSGFMILATLLVGLKSVYDYSEIDAAIASAQRLANDDAIDPEYLSIRPGGDEGFGNEPLELTPKAEAFVQRLRDCLKRVSLGLPPNAGEQPVTEHPIVRDVNKRIDGLIDLGFKNHELNEIRANCSAIADGLIQLKSLRQGKAIFADVPRSEYGQVKSIGAGPRELPAANVSAIGRTVYSDHLLAVELAGTLLLVATVGAIAIAARREKAIP